MSIRLGSFETLHEVGAGGMGTVWRGQHVVTGAAIAVKFLTAEHARDPRWLTAFSAEARAIARLGHPRIVRIFDVGMVPETATLAEVPAGSPYIVMEWIGDSLDSLPRPLAWEPTREILLEVLDALAHVHARNIVHRDIKPSNVLGKLGRLRLADFGIARVDEDTEDTISGVSGTPYFMAPEQFTKSCGRVDSWTDLYAVGCLAHLLITGEPPFGGDSIVMLAAQHLNNPFPLQSFHPDLRRWLARMTAKNPFARYRFASEAARDLAPIAQAFEEASVAPTERWISPAYTASDTVPLTTILLDPGDQPATEPIWVEASMAGHVPRHVPDWRTPQAARTHVEHMRGAGLAVSTMRIPPFVGRTAERDELWAMLREGLLSGCGTATVITGPAGIGKSRLGHWLAVRAHELGLAPHIGPVSCRVTDEPFVRLALDELGVPANDTEYIRERMEQRLAGSDVTKVERNAMVRFLSGELAASAPRERLDAMRAALNLCAGGRPLIVLLDDIEDAPGEVLEAVFHTLRAKEFVHFVLTSSRPIPDPKGRLHHVELGPLDDAYLARIVRDLAGLHQDLAAEIVGASGRNPGHAIRLVHDLVERGALRGGDHGFELLSDAQLHPADADALWRERLEHLIRDLGPTTRGALELAAVLGDEVATDQWHELAAAAQVFVPSKLQAELDQRGFVVATSRGWAFSDPRLRDLVKQSAQDRNTWRTYVAAARTTFEHAPRVLRAAWDLDVGRVSAATEGFLHAARQAERQCQYTRAVRLLNRLEGLVERLDEEAADRLRAEVAVLKARIWGLDRVNDADEVAKVAVDLASEHGWDDILGAALERRAAFARKRVELEEARTLYEASRDASVRAGDDVGRGLALQGLGMVAVAQGANASAEELYNEALSTFLEVPQLRGAAWCANGLGDAYRRTGRYELARRWYTRALNWFEQVGHAYGAMWCVHDLALTCRQSGNLAGAGAGLEQTIRMAGRLGQRVVAPRLNLGIVYVLRGEPERARHVFEEVLEESELRGIGGEEAIAHVCLLPCEAAAGRWDDLRIHLDVGRQKLGSLVDADLGLMASAAARDAREAGEEALADELAAFAKTHGVE